MEFSTILAILGILVSGAFGLWGIRRALGGQYAGEATFVWERPIALFDEIVRDLGELSVTYKGKPVRENLVLLKGALVNTGKLDIAPTMVEEPVRLVLPEGHKWVTAVVLSASPGVSASLQLEGERAIMLQMGLLRCGEFVRMQTLAELAPTELRGSAAPKSPDEILQESLKFTHRIANIRQIVSGQVYEPGSKTRLARSASRLMVAGLLILAVLCILVYVRGLPQQLIYRLRLNSEGRTSEYVVRAHGTEQIRVKELATGRTTFLSPQEFYRSLAGPPGSRTDPVLLWMTLFFIIVYLVIPLIVLVTQWRQARKNSRLRKILGLDPGSVA